MLLTDSDGINRFLESRQNYLKTSDFSTVKKMPTVEILTLRIAEFNKPAKCESESHTRGSVQYTEKNTFLEWHPP